MDNYNIPVLIITGPVGVGKTSVAWEVSEILEDKGINHAFIDADVSYIYPKPEEDPRGLELYYRNLDSIWTNMKNAGAKRLILTKVIESAEDLEKIKKVLPETEIQIVRLHAPIEVISERLAKREIGAGLEWHKQRAQNFLDIWEKSPIDAQIIHTYNREVREIAEEILNLAKWL